MSVYVIAEAGVNHNGSIDLAYKLIDLQSQPLSNYSLYFRIIYHLYKFHLIYYILWELDKKIILVFSSLIVFKNKTT